MTLCPSLPLFAHSDHNSSPVFLGNYRIDLVKDARFIYIFTLEGGSMGSKLLQKEKFQFGVLTPLLFSLAHLNGLIESKSPLKNALGLYQKIYTQIKPQDFPLPFLHQIAKEVSLISLDNPTQIQTWIYEGALYILIPFLSINLMARHPTRGSGIFFRWRQESPMKEIFAILSTIGESPEHKIDQLFSLKSSFESLMETDESLYNAIGSQLLFYADDFEKKLKSVHEIASVEKVSIGEAHLLGAMLADLIILRTAS